VASNKRIQLTKRGLDLEEGFRGSTSLTESRFAADPWCCADTTRSREGGLAGDMRLGTAIRNAPAHVAAGILVVGLIASVAALPIAAVFGTLGGSWGEELLGTVGVPIGIALAFLLIPAAFFAAGGAVGGSLAWGVGRLILGARRPDVRQGHGSSRQG
jgi:hypothetical protein